LKLVCDKLGCNRISAAGLVVCLEHATKETLIRRIRLLEKETKDLRKWATKIQYVANTALPDSSVE